MAMLSGLVASLQQVNSNNPSHWCSKQQHWLHCNNVTDQSPPSQIQKLHSWQHQNTGKASCHRHWSRIPQKVIRWSAKHITTTRSFADSDHPARVHGKAPWPWPWRFASSREMFKWPWPCLPVTSSASLLLDHATHGSASSMPRRSPNSRRCFDCREESSSLCFCSGSASSQLKIIVRHVSASVSPSVQNRN